MGNITPTIDLPKTKVRCTTHDPETGEIIERVIPAKSLRPRPPKEPKEPQLDQRLITEVSRDTGTGPTGRSVIAMIDHRERLIDHRAKLEVYWEFFAHHLRRDEQRKLARGEGPAITRPVKPGWKTGDRMYIAADMEAEVLSLIDKPEEYGAVFRICDYRARLLKRGVLGDDIPATDEHGYAPELTPTEKERARIEGAYTTSAARAVDDAGAVMDEDALRRIHADQPAGNALTQTRGRVALTKGRLQRRLAEAKAKHRTGTARYLERQLERLETKEAA